ncbi:4'-phosphopantetheinyl transferase superfamily protein [Marinihelvus fidelis]|uniref:4'-phosphopantetheinyl transferase superfamily protein n=1 Tax=Marinihelvus fidelis TaxID=2613842 RepID=A0A5N0TBZ2_9GAMM|nr:4'-phosphopantetheinyl transferase superfamily protein [Marinihelvus fidelis]KAA9130859.1 4'-phosphopantetheinyl transferase superfamily protein [Marinihelvus fidelis]
MSEELTPDYPEFQARSLPLRDLELPDAGVAHLWFMDLVELGNPMDPATGIDRARFTPPQQRTLRRFYLRLLLGAYMGLPGKDVSISRAVRGKPVLDAGVHEPVLDFSLAASDGCCLVGVTRGGLIGVDLELVGRKAGKPMSLARRYFSAAEQAELGAIDTAHQDEAFLHAWACKEAVVKAAGHGIANRLCRFTVNVSPALPPAITAMDDDDPAQWQMAVFRPGERHLGAIAVRQETLRLEGFRLGRREE